MAQFDRPQYINWFLEKTDGEVRLASGEVVSVFSIVHQDDDEKLNEWAKHILKHYRTDEQLQRGANRHCGGDVSKYITEFVIEPTKPKDVSGDFGEFVFSDFMEYVLGYEVPRYKKLNTYPSNPTQGIDIFGFKLGQKNEVVFMEVKASLPTKNFSKLGDAITESIARDETKRALVLEDAILKLEERSDSDTANRIVRLLSSDNPPVRFSAAGVITTSQDCSSNDFIGISISNGQNCMIFALHGNQLWELAKNLYERACI